MIDLQPFCGPDASRYALDKPWNKGGFTFATDGRVCVRLPTSEPDTVDDQRSPKIEDTLFEGTGDWQKWPKVKKCGKCENGYAKRDCRECDGLCKHTCSCGHEHDCGECDGEGEVETICDCRNESTRICGVLISNHYAWLIGRLPKVECRVSRTDQLLVFRFDGGVGVVMGMREPQ